MQNESIECLSVCWYSGVTDRSISDFQSADRKILKTLILVWGGNSKELGVDSNGDVLGIIEFDVSGN